MRNFLRRLKYAFRPKLQPAKDETGSTIIPAFTDKTGVTYYMHEDPMNVLTGRGLSAMQHMEELLMRCDIRYLRDHIKATDEAYTVNKGRMNVQQAITLNNMLKQRIEMLAALPENVYRMASVVFFDPKTENASTYNPAVADRKIAEWKKDPDAYAFFLQTPLKDLIPALQLQESMQVSKDYLKVQEKINQHHLSTLSEMLSKNTQTQDI